MASRNHALGWLGVACLVLASCSSSSPDGGGPGAGSSSPVADGTSSVEPADEPASSGPCANPYMPIVRGVTWGYAVSSNVGDSSYEDVVTSVRADGFTVTSRFPDLTKKTEWSCTPEGLVALQFGGGASASISSSTGTRVEFRTTDVDGVTIPADPRPGDAWSQSFTVEGEQTIEGGATATTEGRIRMRFDAAGLEMVSVEAGDYRALEVNLRISFDLIADVEGVTVPFTFDAQGGVWYAEGVGAVKSTSGGSIFGGRVTATVELTEFSGA